jgi:uncharacterized protein (TIGR03086 family)
MTDLNPLPLSIDHLDAAHSAVKELLRLLRPDQWALPTPCTEWTLRTLVNHLVLGELGYALLLRGGSGQMFLAMQDRDAPGGDALAGYDRAALECRSAFREPGALDRVLDYPLGAVRGDQLLGLRVTETVIHTWDLARASGADDRLDPDLVEWAYHNLEWTYRGIADSPIASGPEHPFFAASHGVLPASASVQDRLLHRTGRVRQVPTAGR